MIQPLILHIPHSSTRIPFKDGFVVNDLEFEEEQILLTDWYTSEIFTNQYDVPIQADFSRIFCDVERFIEDKKEIMSNVGMGVLYTNTDDGRILRKITPELRERILTDFYLMHHQRLNQTVVDQLLKFGRTVIIDCHSFPSIPLNRDLNQRKDRPDINIGTDKYHTPMALIEITQSFCKDYGFSLGVNWPYQGTIVPMEYYNSNPNVVSLMIEINRKLYLSEGTNQRNSNFNFIKQTMMKFLDRIRNAVI
jgi:N-formylglutamate amidohydrolase